MFITLINKESGLSVPFYLSEFGEIVINSTKEIDTDDKVEVKTTKLCYEHSIDTESYYISLANIEIRKRLQNVL